MIGMGESSNLSPVLGEMFDSLEGRDELERDEALFISLDVLQQELVLADVGVREVELNLKDTTVISLDVFWQMARYEPPIV